jgi:hypothetical protein
MGTMLQRQMGEWRSVGAVEHRRTAQKAVNTFRMSDNCFALMNGWTRRRELGTLTAQETYSGAEPSSAFGGGRCRALGAFPDQSVLTLEGDPSCWIGCVLEAEP